VDDDEAKTQTCAQCGSVSQPISTNYTLIGAGWRLTRLAVPRGDIVVEWLCPACFAARKRATQGE
jgi:hypothetical protein